MKAYMTSGTEDFLVKMVDDHPQLDLFIMSNEASTLIYYEDEQKSIFAAGRGYNILLETGAMEETGFVVMNNIPVSDEGKPVFEANFRKQLQSVEEVPGIQALRLLKPLKGNTYVVLTQWHSEKNYDDWKESEAFSNAHKPSTVKPPAYFLEQPFIATYSMYVPEDKEEEV